MTLGTAVMDQKPNKIQYPPSYRLFPSVRLLMITISFLGMTANYAGFATLNFAIVCMVKSGNASGNCSDSDYGGEFDWDRSQQSNLLAAYAWGATLAALPVGWLTDKFGGRWVFLAHLLLHAIASAVTPMAAYGGYYWIFTARILVGMAAGGSIPCLTSVCSRWAPEKERTLLTTIALNGTNMGSLLAIALSGIMCQSRIGWPLIFYTWAGASALMALVWFFFYTDDPEKCRFISVDELEILKTIGRRSVDPNQPKLKTPWRGIMFSKVTWAIFVCHFCVNWSVAFIDEFVPTYSKEMLGMSVESNGLYSALPGINKFVATLIFGIMAEKMTCRSFSKTISVKFFNTLAMGVPAVCMLALAFFNRNTGVGLAVFLFCLCAFFYLAIYAGVLRGILLVAPKFCGTISAVSHVFGYGGMIAMPYVVGTVTTHATESEWHTAFYITLALSAIGCVEFVIFASGEEQEWAKGKLEKNGIDEYGKEDKNWIGSIENGKF